MLKHWRNKNVFMSSVWVWLFCRLWYVHVAEGLVICTGTLRSTSLYCWVFLCVAQWHCAALRCTVGYSFVLHRDIAQHFVVLLGILVCCTGTLRSTLLYCWVLLCVAQGHCAVLYCTVGYSCVLHRDIAQHFIVLLGIIVCCTGTLRSTLLYCWVFLCVAQGHCAVLYCTVGYSWELHEVCPHFSLVLVLQLCFRCFSSR